MPIDEARVAAAVRQYEVEQFLYSEAALLDEHRYEEWLTLFADDLHYWMPIRRTVSRRDVEREFTKPDEVGYFNETKHLLTETNERAAELAIIQGWSTGNP